MQNRPFIALAMSFCLFSPLAVGGVVQPGLWETNSTKMAVDGEQMPNTDAMLEQLKNLPPEQRQMVEKMLAERGVALGAKGLRVCLTPEQVEVENIPMLTKQSGCTSEITDRSTKRVEFRFTCPNGSGAGEALISSDREFITRYQGQTQVPGQVVEHTDVETVSRWISADCAGVQPDPQ